MVRMIAIAIFLGSFPVGGTHYKGFRCYRFRKDFPAEQPGAELEQNLQQEERRNWDS